MTGPSIMQEIDALIRLLRSHGVSEYTGVVGELPIGLKFFAVESSPAPLKSDALPVESETCACGCPIAGHMSGMCVTAGCSPEKCEAKK